VAGGFTGVDGVEDEAEEGVEGVGKGTKDLAGDGLDGVRSTERNAFMGEESVEVEVDKTGMSANGMLGIAKGVGEDERPPRAPFRSLSALRWC